MLATFKEVVLPLLVYLLVWATCLHAVVRNASTAVFLFAFLCVFPMFWYPAQVFPLGSLTLTLLLVSAWWGNTLQRPDKDVAAPSGWLIWWLILSSYLSIWNTSLRYGLAMPLSPGQPVVAYWKNYAMMLALYFIAFHALDNRDKLRRLVMLVMLALLLMSWREIANFVAGDAFSYDKRSNGPFWIVGLGANHFGAFIAHFMVFVLGVSLLDNVRWRRWLGRITFVIALYPLFFSYSRGAYAAVLIALIILGLVRHKSLIVVVGVLLVFWQDLLPQSVVDRIDMTEGDGGEIEESAAMRIVMWELAKSLFNDHPVFGVGFVGFAYASEGLPLRNVHNYFLQTAAEQGVVGLLLIGLLFGRAIYCGWRLYREGEDGWLQGMGLGFVACTVAVMVSNIFGDRFSQLEVGSYFWLLMGAVDRAWMLSTSDAAAPTEPVKPTAGQARGRRST